MRKNIPIDVFDEYVLRAPVLSLTEIMNVDENQLIDFLKNNSLLDAIFLASPDLEFDKEMRGSAEIITEDLRLIERVFYQFRELFQFQ